ncbi:MAG: tRNA/rRNA cytosine-C5-methylase [uncultured bacterium (gcode 4)]|uniref:tRNA/rRNA cytosine-C5-methylase n=1 Tax=uncultured bacterium (gcode 4) TaxID=1234023 RepID=K2G057_9BACT|nr:MAG: tRNA/rRNA cytosine-C5-methylase [uncultured bacterium (gcode 4)]
MTNLPLELLERLKKIYTEKDYQDILAWFDAERITSFRINTLLSDKKEVEDYLNENEISFRISDFSEITYIIDKKHEFALKWSRLFYSGKIYVQGIASQIPALVLAPEKWDIILDVTAAPWSKTTQIAAMTKNSCRIVAAEKNQIRFDKLNYNLKLQWVTCTQTVKIDALDLDKNFEPWTFDRILLDAPCSAEWRINTSNEKTFWFWTLDNIAKKQELQLSLLEHVIPLLKKWGTIVYSTCTLAPEENEEVVDTILKKHFNISLSEIDIALPKTIKWITEFGSKKYSKDMNKTIRINPSALSEGFFVAKLIKE